MDKMSKQYVDESTQYKEVYGDLTFEIEKRWSFETERSRFPTVPSYHLFVNGEEVGFTHGDVTAIFAYMTGRKDQYGEIDKKG